MNVRKPVDYSAMFAALDLLMMAALPQMELYCEIGQLVSGRPEVDILHAKQTPSPAGKWTRYVFPSMDQLC